MRYKILDGFRGYFLLFMSIVHIDGIVDVALGKVNHHWLGWVEDAQGFVFISGLVVGLVYGGVYLRRSFEDMRRGIRARMRLIFTYHAGLTLAILGAALLMGSLGHATNIVNPYRAEPVVFPLLSLGLLGGSAFMGILPMYLWFMALTPWVLRQLREGRALSVLVLSVGLWLLAQTRLPAYLGTLIGQGLEAVGIDAGIGLGFNLLAWQAIFFLGLWLGFLQAEGRLDLSLLRRPEVERAMPWLLGLVLGLAVFDRLVAGGLMPAFGSLAWTHLARENLTPVYLVNFVADLVLVTWVIVAGPTSQLGWAPPAARALTWLFTRPFLVFLGQHSLQVFAWHVAVAYLIDFAFAGRDLGEAGGTLVMVLGTLSIYVPAWLHARSVASRKAARQAAQGAPA